MEYLDKSDVIRMFNLMIQQDPQTEGKYANFHKSNLMQSATLNGYKWQAAYYTSYGNISAFRIELIYDDGTKETYLSDLVADGKATDEQKKIYDKYKQIEKDVIKENSFVTEQSDSKAVIGNVNFSILSDLLKQLEKGD